MTIGRHLQYPLSLLHLYGFKENFSVPSEMESDRLDGTLSDVPRTVARTASDGCAKAHCNRDLSGLTIDLDLLWLLAIDSKIAHQDAGINILDEHVGVKTWQLAPRRRGEEADRLSGCWFRRLLTIHRHPLL